MAQNTTQLQDKHTTQSVNKHLVNDITAEWKVVNSRILT